MPAPTGPRLRSTTGRNRNSTRNIASKGGNIKTALNRDRTTGQGGVQNKPPLPVSPPNNNNVAAAKALATQRAIQSDQRVQTAFRIPQLGQLPDTTAATQSAAAAYSNMTALALGAMYASGQGVGTGGSAISTGPGGPHMRQLVKGFRAADDPAMARFVKRNPNLVKIWLRQESGLDPAAISPPNNQGDPNYGLFQFARLDPGARPWLEKFIKGQGAGRFTATPFQQAQLAARYFDLTPADVRRYVREIKAGTYKGWG
jgi:hypothetical protein